MTTDLWMLLYTGLLSLFFFLTYGTGRLLAPGGIEWGFGNREKPPAAPEWTARGQRAHNNLVENLAPFAILVIVAHLTGKPIRPPRSERLSFSGRALHTRRRTSRESSTRERPPSSLG
jgi:uncharacterized MAPEG superfamily protein